MLVYLFNKVMEWILSLAVKNIWGKLDISRSFNRIFEMNLQYTYARCKKY